jgi:hypothetical protein
LRAQVDGGDVEAMFATACEHARMGASDGSVRQGTETVLQERD